MEILPKGIHYLSILNNWHYFSIVADALWIIGAVERVVMKPADVPGICSLQFCSKYPVGNAFKMRFYKKLPPIQFLLTDQNRSLLGEKVLLLPGDINIQINSQFRKLPGWSEYVSRFNKLARVCNSCYTANV